jgi:omega-amidase
MEDLKVTLVQYDIFWEDIDKNLQYLDEKLSLLESAATDLIVLPEMFATGFSMNAEKLAESMNGKTMKWMKHIAQQKQCVVTGSIITKENYRFYNRLIWMRPDGTYECYDKRHLFAMGKEHDNYISGEKRIIVELKGWHIAPFICYDLRFPVWLRNINFEYDLLLLVANWPERRISHWRTLINARAIENQACVVAVNRVGNDGNEVYHSGDSLVVDAMGNELYHKKGAEDIQTVTLPAEELIKTRDSLPFLKDADSFNII